MLSTKPYIYYNTLAKMLNIEAHTLAEYTDKKHRHLWKLTNGRARQSFAVAAVRTIESFLTTLSASNQVRERSRVGGLDLESVVAWYLYAQQQSGITAPGRYTLQQTAVGKRPPDLYWRFSHLSWELWRTYAAVWSLQPSLSKAQIHHFIGFPSFYDWGRVYGRLPCHQLPFGVGLGVADLTSLLSSTNDSEVPSRTNIDNSSDTPPVCRTAVAIDDDSSTRMWESILYELSLQMTKATFNAWLLNTQLLACNGNEYTIGVCNQYAQAWLQQRLRPVIIRTIAAMTRQEAIHLRFVVGNV
jgi:hypothetical protein